MRTLFALCILATLSFPAGDLLASQALEGNAGNTLPLQKKGDDFQLEDGDYRYDFGDRHLTWGFDLAGDLSSGITLKAFPYGGGVTPYFKVNFGDGNAVQIDLSAIANPISGPNYPWLFFRTPVFPGSSVSGYTLLLAPVFTFKYEVDMGSSVSKRSPVQFWGGLGIGPLLTIGSADITDNGDSDTHLSNTEVFFQFVPTVGFKFRLSEFAFINLGFKYHLMLDIASRVNDEEVWSTGTPRVIQEFWLGNSAYFETTLGFSYDFG